jgi:hypothetical protein
VLNRFDGTFNSDDLALPGFTVEDKEDTRTVYYYAQPPPTEEEFQEARARIFGHEQQLAPLNKDEVHQAWNEVLEVPTKVRTSSY